MNLIRIKNRTDKAVFAVTATTFLTFLMANRIGTIWILYPNVLIAVSLFIYCTLLMAEDTSDLSSSSIFGITTILTYAPLDWLFSRKAHLIFYLRSDFLSHLTTPIGIILNWIVFATLAAYCYQRLTAIFRTRFASDTDTPRIGLTGTALLAAGITGIGAAIGSNVIYALGESHLWVWNATQVDRIPQIAAVPIFVPATFLVTLLLCPYFFGIAGGFLRAQQVGIAGVRCGIFMGALQFLSFLLFYISK